MPGLIAPLFVGYDDDGIVDEVPIDTALCKQLAENAAWVDNNRRAPVTLTYLRPVAVNIGPTAVPQTVPRWYGAQWHLRGPFPFWAPPGLRYCRVILAGDCSLEGANAGDVACQMIAFTSTGIPAPNADALDDLILRAQTSGDYPYVQTALVGDWQTVKFDGVPCDGGVAGAWRWVYVAVRSALGKTGTPMDVAYDGFGGMTTLSDTAGVFDLGEQPEAWYTGLVDANDMPSDRRNIGTVMFAKGTQAADRQLWIAEAPSLFQLNRLIPAPSLLTGAFGALGTFAPTSVTIDPNGYDEFTPQITLQSRQSWPDLRYYRPVGVRNVSAVSADTNRQVEACKSQLACGVAQRGFYGGQWRVFDMGGSERTTGTLYRSHHWNVDRGVAGQVVAYEAHVPLAVVGGASGGVRQVTIRLRVFDSAGDLRADSQEVSTTLNNVSVGSEEGNASAPITASWAYLTTRQFTDALYGMTGKQKCSHDGAVWPSEAWSFFTPVVARAISDYEFNDDETYTATLTVGWGGDPSLDNPWTFSPIVVGNWGVRVLGVTA